MEAQISELGLVKNTSMGIDALIDVDGLLISVLCERALTGD